MKHLEFLWDDGFRREFPAETITCEVGQYKLEQPGQMVLIPRDGIGVRYVLIDESEDD
jgi:hypothetical protein